MTVKTYALKRGDKKTLKVEWQGAYKNLRLTLDGREIGQVPDKLILKTGKSFLLPDGATLAIVLEKNKLKIKRNGLPLPGTADDPAQKLNISIGFMIFVGFATIGMSQTPSVNSASDPRLTAINVGIGFSFWVMAVLAYGRQRWAVWAAVIIFGIVLVLNALGILEEGARGDKALFICGVVIIIFRIIILYCLFQGVSGIDGLEAESAALAQKTVKPNRPALTRPVIGAPPPITADTIIREAYQHIAAGNLAVAKPSLAAYMRQNPENAYGWFLASFVLNNPAQQTEALRRALRYDPALKAAQDRLAALEAGDA